MKKTTVVLAILLTVLMSGCAPRPLPDVPVYIEERVKAPTSVEEAYNRAWYLWKEDSKTETTSGAVIHLPYRISGRIIGRVSITLQKINKEYRLINIVVGGVDCRTKRGCYRGEYHANFDFGNAIDKNAGALTRGESQKVGHEIWFITDEQIKIMSIHGADLSLKYNHYNSFMRDFPGSGYMEIQVPAVYVQGFLKKVNELHNKTK